MLEMVMTALDPHEIPTVSLYLSDEVSAIHTSSLRSSMVVTITTKLNLSMCSLTPVFYISCLA